MPIRRASISLKRGNALTLTRVSIGRDKLVYVLLADKKLDYANGRSRIAYIGTTKNGVARIASSAAAKAQSILGRRGIKALEARVVTTHPRQKVAMWRKLERGLILAFKDQFDEPPRWNTHGKRMKWTDEERYFKKTRLATIIEDLS